MIPEFPTLDKITLNQRDEIVTRTKTYPPYSDYDFTTLWSWDVEEKRKISSLNDNLVIEFTDYITGEGFYSFFGNNRINETVKTLFEFAHSQGMTNDLRFIPELVLGKVNIQSEEFALIEDFDNHDYIYSIDKLVDLQGSEYGQARNLLSRFMKRNGDINVRQLNLSNPQESNLILEVNKKWQNNKGIYIQAEEKALKRLITNSKDFNLEAFGIFVKEEIVGYAISEVLYEDYAIAHFAQADTNYAGIYAFLMKQIAESLQKKGSKLLNYEQDLGLPRLRQGKMSYRPVSFLKKFSIVKVE
jgi:uncharacterized protein